jgi:hypothetical protein
MPIDIAELDRQRRIPNLGQQMPHFPLSLEGLGMEASNRPRFRGMVSPMLPPQGQPLAGLGLSVDYNQKPSRLIEALMRLNNNNVASY